MELPEVCATADNDYDDDDDDCLMHHHTHPSIGRMPHPSETTTNHSPSTYQRGKVLKSKKRKLRRMVPAEVVETRRPKHFVLIAESIRKTYEQLIMEESRKAHFNSNPDDGDTDGSSIVVNDPSSKETAIIKNKNNDEMEKNRQLYVRLPKSPNVRAKVQLPTEVSNDRRWSMHVMDVY
jgi:hypothetical protein